MFHFIMLFLKHGKERESFMFCGIKDQIFGDNKDIVSVQYHTAFIILSLDFWHIIHYALLNHMVLFY